MGTAATQITIESADGTALAAETTGDGPPLVLVHGAVDDRSGWAFVAPLLAQRHRVWTFDRRGRGASGDGPTYSLDNEADDVLAVVRAAGPGTHLVGHSFGAVCALEAVRRAAARRGSAPLASLALYEPPLRSDRVATAVARAEALIADGDLDAGLSMFMLEVVGLSADELAMARSVPGVWPRLLATAAATLEREAAALRALGWRPDRYGAVSTPVLHITGELTSVPTYLTHTEVVSALPQAEHSIISGQRHLAALGAPDVFADAVLRFTSTHT